LLADISSFFHFYNRYVKNEINILQPLSVMYKLNGKLLTVLLYIIMLYDIKQIV